MRKNKDFIEDYAKKESVKQQIRKKISKKPSTPTTTPKKLKTPRRSTKKVSTTPRLHQKLSLAGEVKRLREHFENKSEAVGSSTHCERNYDLKVTSKEKISTEKMKKGKDFGDLV